MPIHNHLSTMVTDDDTALFTIDPITRSITYNSEDELIIMQNDSNSERLTFEIPKIVEGHNMLDCNVVQIHYINTGANGIGNTVNIYQVTDLAEHNEETLRFSWLVSRNATKHVGLVRFAVRFFCTNSSEEIDDGEPVTGKILYEWSTGVSSVIKIGESIRNTEAVAEDVEYDLLEGWKEQLTGTYQWVPDMEDPNYPNSPNVCLQLTTIDGRIHTSESLRCTEPGEQGPKGDKPEIEIGTVKTIDYTDPDPKVTAKTDDDGDVVLDFVLPEPERSYVTDIRGNPMWFFVGTQDEYQELTDEEKDKVFALITNEDIPSEVVDKLSSDEEFISEVGNKLLSNDDFKNDLTEAADEAIEKSLSSATSKKYYHTITVCAKQDTNDGTYLHLYACFSYISNLKLESYHNFIAVIGNILLANNMDPISHNPIASQLLPASGIIMAEEKDGTYTHNGITCMQLTSNFTDMGAVVFYEYPWDPYDSTPKSFSFTITVNELMKENPTIEILQFAHNSIEL